MQKALIVEHGGFDCELAYVTRPTAEEIDNGGWSDWFKSLIHYVCDDTPRHKVESYNHNIYLNSIKSAQEVIKGSKSAGACPGTNNSIYYLTDEQWDAILSEYNALLQSKLDKIAKTEDEETEKKDKAFAEAARTGEPVVINSWMEDCDGSVEECSTDMVTLCAMPDGTTKTSRSHSF
jgi:hypothetical protein